MLSIYYGIQFIVYLYLLIKMSHFIDCGFSAHTKCSEKLPPDCCPELKSSRSVFGVDLTTLVRAKKTVRPFVVDKCIQEIEVKT